MLDDPERGVEDTACWWQDSITWRTDDKDDNRDSHCDGRDQISNKETPRFTTKTDNTVLANVSNADVADHRTEVDTPVEPVKERFLLKAVLRIAVVELIST